MQTLIVAGKVKGVGKTTLVREMIKNLKPDLGVIKTSVHKEVSQLLVTDDPEIIHKSETDTGKFIASGATKVVFLETSYAQLKTGLEKAYKLVGEVRYLIIEGTSVLDLIQPDLTIFLTSSLTTAKPSAVQAETKADLIIDKDLLFATLQRGGKIPFQITRELDENRLTLIREAFDL